MEGTPESILTAKERPPYPRASSRSSTNTSNTRMTHKSANSSSAVSNPSPAKSSCHTTRRNPNDDVCGPSPIERPRSQFSRASTDASRLSLPPVSSFLQEKLQREREVEGERTSSMASTDLSRSVDLRIMQNSPVRDRVAEARRPRSSGGSDQAPKRMGIGLKEMEQTLSSLHKQIWDLKLELYHRREGQMKLEQRVERLEAEKEELEQANDCLVGEIKQRDSAVQEAVSMIVTLEGKVDQMMREREMVRQVDEEVYRISAQSESVEPANETPKLRAMEMPKPQTESKTLERMPSFLSDMSERTENLRYVYLGIRGSVLSLPRASDDPRECENGQSNRMTSPSMSVLSESSFTSIYGQQQRRETESSIETDATPRLAGSPFGQRLLPQNAPTPQKPSRVVTPSRMARKSGFHSNSTSQVQGMNGIVGLRGSPLQQLQNQERRSSTGGVEQQHSTPKEFETPPAVRPSKPQAQLAKTKQEKRDALKRVLTDSPAFRDLVNSEGLPPTPDTISTSTLRRYKNSNETLHQQAATNERSYLTLSDTTMSRSMTGEETAGDATAMGNEAHPRSNTAFPSRRETSGSSYFEDRLPIPQRPRSAGETTTSRRGNGWDSDSDESDDDSRASSFDYWMRESMKPNRADGRTSPDLFSFPSNTDGWAANEMFGSLGGTGFMGAPLARTLDALGDSLPSPALLNMSPAAVDGSGPPAPNRRSSLHARTGSSSAIQPVNGKLRKSPVRKDLAMSRTNSSDGQAQPRTGSLTPQQPPAPQPGKLRHYPPSAGQAPRARSLFRRSLGAVPTSELPPPASAPPTETSFPPGATMMNVPLVGIPSWGRRGDVVDEDRDSATPPPIMRNRASTLDGGNPAMLAHEQFASPGLNKPSPLNPCQAPTAGPTLAEPANITREERPSTGGTIKRRWLEGLGRVSGSLRNRGS